MCLETGKGGDINSDRRKNPLEPKIQFESGEAMEKCEKSVCLPATAPEQRLETQHWLTRAWPGQHSVQRGHWSLMTQ